MLLNVRDAKKTEAEISPDQEVLKKKDGPAPPKHSCSVPDLRKSGFLSCSGLELGQPICRIREAKSTSAVNMLAGTVVSGAVSLPEG